MPILVGIDGTGSAIRRGERGDRTYDEAFRWSFVRSICFPDSTNRRYRRGPWMLGGALPDAIEAGKNFIVRRHRIVPNEPILLTGYSRGALGVVVIAAMLKQLRINVSAMLLFDCVDRHVRYDAEYIPNNVARVHHVMRNPHARSRRSFGNDATKYDASTTNYTSQYYFCTHGGMGGTPWQPEEGDSPDDYISEGFAEGLASTGSTVGALFYRTNVTFAQDARESARIWNDVQGFLNQYGFYRAT